MSFAVMQLPSESPKDGRTVTLTFCVSHAAMEKVTGEFPFADLKQLHKPSLYRPIILYNNKHTDREQKAATKLNVIRNWTTSTHTTIHQNKILSVSNTIDDSTK